VQVGDLWVWPDQADVPPFADGSARGVPRRPGDTSLHWRRLPRDLFWVDGSHHPYWLTRGVAVPTCVALGLTFLPRDTVLTLPGEPGPLRVGVLGGADSIPDAQPHRLGDDGWPEEARVSAADVDRLLANVREAGGIDVLVTHTPPASVTARIMNGAAPHFAAVLVEEGWRAPPAAGWTTRRLS